MDSHLKLFSKVGSRTLNDPSFNFWNWGEGGRKETHHVECKCNVNQNETYLKFINCIIYLKYLSIPASRT